MTVQATNYFPYPEQWPPKYVSVFQWRQRMLLQFREHPAMLRAALAYYSQPEHCVDFIEHWMTTYDPRNAGTGKLSYLPFVLFPKQRLFVKFIFDMLDHEQHGLVEKCRDMGATWLAGAISVWLWRFVPGMSIGWGSRKQELVDKLGDADSIFEKLRILIRNLPLEFVPTGFRPGDHMPFMRIINPQSGATITGEVGDNIGRGGRKRIYFKDESAHYERPDMIEASLSENTRVQIDISSVNGIGNVFERRRTNGIEWTPDHGPFDKTKASVFVMEWRDHPEKDQAWYNTKRAKAAAEGLLPMFRQEIDRDYGASLSGICIKPEWIDAAVDAHIELGFTDVGVQVSGLDIADGGEDRNAQIIRKGSIVKFAKEWGDTDDVGVSAQRALININMQIPGGPVSYQYDSIGIGAGVKSETNRLKRDGLLTRKGITFQPWNAGATCLYPEQRLIRGDKDTPTNEDFFGNIKAQAWWQLARRFERTYKAIVEGILYQPEELISLPRSLEMLQSLRRQLAQAVWASATGKGRLLVDKAPEGTKSPNLADACVMAFWPIMPIVIYDRKTVGTVATA
jgi:phage terminase large subunit